MVEFLTISMTLAVCCGALYFLFKLEDKRRKKYNAVLDEIFIYFKNMNNKEK